MLKGWFSVHYQPEKQPKWDALRNDLMDRKDPAKQANALEQIVLLSFSEAIPPHLLMPIIQYTATTIDHRVIKLLFLFLENVEIRDARGEIRPEFILITDAIRNFLLSHNEYVRIAAMRFLYKLNDRDLCQQLLSAILQNLEHADENVRWHAAHLIGRLSRDIEGFNLDTSDSILESLTNESNPRVIPAMIAAAYESAPKEATEHIVNMPLEQTSTDIKIAILKIALDSYKRFPQYRVALLEIVVDLCDDDSTAVRLEAANVLRQLSSNQAAVRTTASTYCDLFTSLTDENQRAFVVQALVEMAEEHRDILSPLALEMSQGANISGQLHRHLLNVLVTIVQKESALSLVPLITSKDKDSLEALRTLLLRFNETSSAIAESIGPFITDQNNDIAELASVLLKDCGIAGAKKEAFRFFTGVLDVCGVESILARAIWSIAEFADDPNIAADLLQDLISDSEPIAAGTETIVNEDGTYSTRTTQGASKTLRQMLKDGNSFLGLALISALIKTKLRGGEISDIQNCVNKVLEFSGVEKNAKDLCNLWLKSAETPNLMRLFRTSATNSFEHRKQNISDNTQTEKPFISASQPLSFTVLYNTAEEVPTSKTEVVDLPIVQLTGPSDSLYVEASCSLRKFDRVYHFTLYNRTEATLTNVLFEFTTVGSVSILQRNDLLSLAPGGSETFDLPVMISSGSCGTLFGAVSFDFAGAGGSDHQLLPLAPIDVDPFFCFEPTQISETSFRSKWAASIWERKIDINTQETDLIAFIDRIANTFKFEIITPRQQLDVTSKSAGFIAANLFTRSLFGEEVEMNVNAKLEKDGKISGFLRIRSPFEQLAFLFGKLIQ